MSLNLSTEFDNYSFQPAATLHHSINHSTNLNLHMKKPSFSYYPLLFSSSLATHPTCIALAVVITIASCAALLLVAGVATSPPPHHVVLFAELQRLSAQLEQSQHQHRQGIDGVGQRLEDLHAALGVLVEAMGSSGGEGGVEMRKAETDMRLKPSLRETVKLEMDENDPDGSAAEDEDAVVVE